MEAEATNPPPGIAEAVIDSTTRNVELSRLACICRVKVTSCSTRTRNSLAAVTPVKVEAEAVAGMSLEVEVKVLPEVRAADVSSYQVPADLIKPMVELDGYGAAHITDGVVATLGLMAITPVTVPEVYANT